MMTTTKMVLVLFTIMSFSFTCVSAQSGMLPQNENGNVELHIVAGTTIDIKVFIDDDLAVDAQFGEGRIFYFNLKPGKHTLRAESNRGSESGTFEFTVTDKKQWLALDYIDTKLTKADKPFIFRVLDTPIMYQ